MATKQPIKKAAATAATPKAETKTVSTNTLPFLFGKQNYIIMVIGVAVILTGFLLMLGKNNTDPSVFNAEDIYSFRRITLAPIVVMLGFAIEIYAILKKPSAA
ncbi:MAG: DUF3098 domain-containing protein [Chitinophagales bacterium]